MPEKDHSSRHLRRHDYPYFRGVWNRVVVALMAVSFVPLIVLGGGVYYYASSVLKQQTLDALKTEVQAHQVTIDRFLAAHTTYLRLVAENMARIPDDRSDLERFLESMLAELKSFRDLGVISPDGDHLAYVGPYDLIDKNYKDADWFRALGEGEVYISDVYTGFRGEPHFIIAVRHVTDAGVRIVRATVDAEPFHEFVAGVTGERHGDAYLINQAGFFQTQPRGVGELMGPSSLQAVPFFDGVRLEERDGQVYVTVWQKKVPWLNVVQIDRDDVFARFHKVRTIALFVFVLGAILIVLTVLLTTNYLVSHLEAKRRSIWFLDQQLRQASALASSMRLSQGLLREVKNTLINIGATTELAIEQGRGGADPSELLPGLEYVLSEGDRCRNTVERFLAATQPTGATSIIADIDVHDLLDGLVGFMNGELYYANIEVDRDYQAQPSSIRSDPALIRQVFQNLILNAVTAIRSDGRIGLNTRVDGDRLTVEVSDTGPGIPKENLDKIFDPLFTTSPEGVGLGLSISLGILEKLGGRISVRSEMGRGSVFTVDLPLRFEPTSR